MTFKAMSNEDKTFSCRAGRAKRKSRSSLSLYIYIYIYIYMRGGYLSCLIGIDVIFMVSRFLSAITSTILHSYTKSTGLIITSQ